MSVSTAARHGLAAGVPSQEALDEVRKNVRGVLEQSAAFRTLPLEKQRTIANQMVQIGTYLVEPEGMRINGNKARSTPYATPMDTTRERVRSSSSTGTGEFQALGAREGATVAGQYLAAVNFPSFVSSLIQGVFHSIVEASIEQMEAYAKLVADVSKSLNQFRDENVTANQGRDHLMDQFPEYFMLDIDTGEQGAQPRIRLRDEVDETEALKRINQSSLATDGQFSSLDDETIEEQLVPAARTQLATSRQQLLATLVLMGINRIIVTDGRIAAKVMYDFSARDNYRAQTSATRFDYGSQYRYTSEGEMESETIGGESSRSRGEGGTSEDSRRDASYYSKGKYKNTAEPVLKLVSATQTNTDAALTTRASLAGNVEVNFRSETFPLEKMADSFQIGRIQDAAKPGQTKTNGAAQNQPAGGQQAPAQQTPSAEQPAGTRTGA